MNVYDTYDLEYIDLKRLESRTRYESTLEEIFERYGRDMTEESDEVDLRTGEVIVDRGHLNSLRVSWFVGEETLNFNDDNHENDFFENILSLISTNRRNTQMSNKDVIKKRFPKKFPSKEQIFQQFGSLGPSIIKLIESQKRKQKQYFKRKKKTLKCSRRNSNELYNSEIQEMNALTHLSSRATSFKFQQMPINILENAHRKNNQNTLFNSLHNVRRFDIIIDCPKSNHSFIQYSKTDHSSPGNALIAKNMSAHPSSTHFFDEYYNFAPSSQIKSAWAFNSQPYSDYIYSVCPSPSESTSHSETEHQSITTSTEQYTDSDTENTHQKKLHCNKLFCFTCSCL
ncbi:unnamed protein product [Pneumocystis jirovecii]|uniref:Uncharacterized protein n=1 Tax=Pneumocystis jirovecii TaxID=42068 RepID=L0P7X0_PNEJI|nr:unnamed protein product [Pneumocystis jirovecii]